MWILTRDQYQTEKVLKRIKKVINDFNFDTTRIVRACTGVKYEFNFE